MKRFRIWLLAFATFAGSYTVTRLAVAQLGATMRLNPKTGKAFSNQMPIVSGNTQLSVTTNTSNVVLTVVMPDAGVPDVPQGWTPPAGNVGQVLGYVGTGTGTTETLGPVSLSYVDGGMSGSGSAGFVAKWLTPTELTNSSLRESGNYTYREATDTNGLYIDTYKANTSYASLLQLRHSYSDTLLGMGTTPTLTQLGTIRFYGVGNVSTWQLGAAISAVQSGSAGTYVPAKLCLQAYSASASNSDQLCLNPDNSATFLGPISAASYPNLAIAFKSADSSVGITTNTNTTANVNLQVQGKQPTLPAGTNGQVLQYATTSTGTTTNIVPGTISGSLPTAKPGYFLIGGTSTNLATATTTVTSSSYTLTMPINMAYGIAGLDISAKVSQYNLPDASTSAWGIVEFSSANPQPDGVASPGYSGYASDSGHVHKSTGRLVATQLFTSTGTATATYSINSLTGFVHVIGRAGGGGGGGGYSTCSGYSAAGGGGAQGSKFEGWCIATGTIALAVGAGGAGGVGTGGNGAAGGNTDFICGAVDWTAPGGSGGNGGVVSGQCVSQLAIGGRSYLGSNAPLQWAGAPGSPGYSFLLADSTYIGVAGNGGGEGGGRGYGVGPGSLAGAGNGSGGSGAIADPHDGAYGGAGAPGFLLVEEYTW